MADNISVEGRPLEQPGESALVERARRGDHNAYGELVTRYQALAARVAFVITASAADAEDVAQDAFVKAFYALDRFREGAPFRPWLLRIVANEAKNRRVAAGRLTIIPARWAIRAGLIGSVIIRRCCGCGAVRWFC